MANLLLGKTITAVNKDLYINKHDINYRGCN